ncbi:hypothetical protein E0198_002096 [Clavispora lusitaniae]|nr:hypothetical protein E0198_002096 [Clavispora lusitaniae]
MTNSASNQLFCPDRRTHRLLQLKSLFSCGFLGFKNQRGSCSQVRLLFCDSAFGLGLQLEVSSSHYQEELVGERDEMNWCRTFGRFLDPMRLSTVIGKGKFHLNMNHLLLNLLMW